MRLKRLIIAVVFFLIPIFARLMWFYNGIPFRTNKHEIPDYAEIKLEEPRISTPKPDEIQLTDGTTTILVDQSHGNLFNLTEIEPLHSELLLRGANILTSDEDIDFENNLPKSNAAIIITPTEPFSAEEIEAIEEFVARGGRLLIVADPTRSDAENLEDKEAIIVQTNQLLQPFGLLFNSDYVYNLQKNEGNYRNVYVKPAGYNDLSANLTSLVFYGSHSIGIFGESIIEADQNTASSLSDAGEYLPVAAVDKSGSVLAIGDVTFMTSPYCQVEDNFNFIQNIAEFLVNAQRIKNLKDFPDLFNQDIGILLTDGISLDSDILSVLSDLQGHYAKDDLQILLLERSQDAFDEIIMGIYPPDDELKEWTDELGFIYENGTANSIPTPANEDNIFEGTITPTPYSNNKQIEGSDKSIIVPEFGAIPRKGFGFLILHSDDTKNQLFILADSQENCVNLLKLVSKGSLSGCLVGESVAICEQDIKSDLYEDEGFEEIEDEEFLDELEAADQTAEPDSPNTPTPSATETPSG